MKQIRFEFLKVFRKPWIPIAIIAFTLVNILAVFLSNQVYKTSQFEDEQNNWCRDRLCGPITQENIDFLVSETNRLNTIISDGTFSRDYDPATYSGYVFKDWSIFSSYLLPNMKYAVNYPYKMQEILIQAQENIDFYRQHGNQAGQNQSYDILRIYSDRSIPEYRNLLPMRYYLQYDFSSVLVLLLMILTFAPVFASEKENKMNQLFPSYPKGTSALLKSKLGFVFLTTFLYSLWFFLIDLLGFFIFSNIQGFSMPLYAILEFELTPLTLTLSEFIMLSFLVKTFGFMIIAALITLISKISPRYLYVLLGGLPLVALFLSWSPKIEAGFTFFNFLNPMFLIKNRNLFLSYKPLVIGDLSVQPVFFALLAGLILLGFFIFLLKFDYKNKNE